MSCSFCGDSGTCFEQDCACVCHVARAYDAMVVRLDVAERTIAEIGAILNTKDNLVEQVKSLRAELIMLRGYKTRVSTTVDLIDPLRDPEEDESLGHAAERIVAERNAARAQLESVGQILDLHGDMSPSLAVHKIRQITQGRES